MTEMGSWCLRNTQASGRDKHANNEPGSEGTDAIKEECTILPQGVRIRNRFPEERVFQTGLERTLDLHRFRKERSCFRSHTDKSKEV